MKKLFAMLLVLIMSLSAFAMADESTWLTPEKTTFTAFATVPANSSKKEDSQQLIPKNAGMEL